MTLKLEDDPAYQDLLNMPLNSMGELSKGVSVIRVPDGWIYKIIEGISVAACFIREPAPK